LFKLDTRVVDHVANCGSGNKITVFGFAWGDVNFGSDNASHAVCEKKRVARFSVALEPSRPEPPDEVWSVGMGQLDLNVPEVPEDRLGIVEGLVRPRPKPDAHESPWCAA